METVATTMFICVVVRLGLGNPNPRIAELFNCTLGAGKPALRPSQHRRLVGVSPSDMLIIKDACARRNLLSEDMDKHGLYHEYVGAVQ